MSEKKKREREGGRGREREREGGRRKEKGTGIISEYEKTILCRNKFVGRVRLHSNDSNE